MVGDILVKIQVSWDGMILSVREKASETFQSRFGLAAYCLPLHLSENRLPPNPMVNHHVFHDPTAVVWLSQFLELRSIKRICDLNKDGVSPICNPG